MCLGPKPGGGDQDITAHGHDLQGNGTLKDLHIRRLPLDTPVQERFHSRFH